MWTLCDSVSFIMVESLMLLDLAAQWIMKLAVAE